MALTLLRKNRATTTTKGGKSDVKLENCMLVARPDIVIFFCHMCPLGIITPEALHMHMFLEQILPAFKWLTWWGFLLGLIESFLWGFYIGIVFVPIYNFLTKRWGNGA